MLSGQKVQYAFIDSGIGGLPYLKYLREREPRVRAVYVADTANFPYGRKNTAELNKIAVKLVGNILELFSPDIVVLACNTLSVAALHILRERFPLPFVGTVPAVKVAAEKTRAEKCVLIASEKAVNDEYTKNLIEKFSSPEKFILKAEQDLIAKVEAGLLFESTEKKEAAVKPIIDFCVSNGADCLVLACTHFLIIEDVFKKVAGKKLQVIESLNGVVEQILKLAPVKKKPEKNSCNNVAEKKSEGEAFFYVTQECSSEEKERYCKIAKYYNLTFGGNL